MATTEELLSELLATAQEHLRWQRAATMSQVRETVDATLTTSQLRRAYEMCDGETASKDIAAEVGTSAQSMSGWTRRWRDLGIAYEASGGIKHLTSLKSLGLRVEVDED